MQLKEEFVSYKAKQTRTHHLLFDIDFVFFQTAFTCSKATMQKTKQYVKFV